MNAWLIVLQIVIGLLALEGLVLDILIICLRIYLRIKEWRLRDAYDHERFD